MNWTLVALILCSVAALGWTEIHKCCTPPKWSGAVEIFKTVDGHRLPVETNLMSYDYTNKRLRRLITVPQEGQPPFKQWLWLVRYDDNVGMLYRLEYSTGKCIKQKLTKDFPKYCTPKSNDTLFDQYLGVRGGYRVQEWYSAYPTRVQKLLVQPVDQFYKGAECYPVLRVNEGRGDKDRFLATSVYTYFETGIRAKDQSKFDIPKECLDAQTVSQVPYDYAEDMTTLLV